jgi:hypothetical protein
MNEWPRTHSRLYCQMLASIAPVREIAAGSCRAAQRNTVSRSGANPATDTCSRHHRAVSSSGAGFVWFLKTQLGCRVPSTAMIAPQSRAFAEALERFATDQGVDLVTFKRGERKDDVV